MCNKAVPVTTFDPKTTPTTTPSYTPATWPCYLIQSTPPATVTNAATVYMAVTVWASQYDAVAFATTA